MYKSKLISLFVFYAVVTFGDALRCYECRTSSGKDCYSPINKDTISQDECEQFDFLKSDYSSGNHNDAQYQCVASLEHHIFTNITWVNRRCIIKRDRDYCKSYTNHQKHEGFIVDECYTCEDDLCNSGLQINANIAFALVFILLCKLCS